MRMLSPALYSALAPSCGGLLWECSLHCPHLLRLATACMQVLTTAPTCSPRPCPRCRWLELLAERDRMKRFFRRLMNMELARSFSSWLSHLDDLAEQARLIGSDCV